MRIVILIGITFFYTTQVVANKVQFSSTDTQTTLIELYSSEGCSSCPPADEFLSQFRNSDELWEQYIPLAFHVDYWDYLGWQDPYAEPAFSNRQRTHKKQGNISSVYTPGFVINGKEWAGFFKAWRVLPENDNKAGKLHLNVDRHLVEISFPKNSEKLHFNLAVLGMGLQTAVKSGENAGHTLPHDFVVLDHQKLSGNQSVNLNLPLIVGKKPQRYALVAWVTLPGSLVPIQAVGGWLPAGSIKSI